MPNEELMSQRKTRSTVVVYVESGVIAEYGLEARYTQVSVTSSVGAQEVYLSLAQQVYEDTVKAKEAAVDAANEAQDSAQDAKDSENLSRQWAINPVNEHVPGSEDYSSMHYALLAESYKEYAELAQQASEQARDDSISAKEESEQARDDSQVHRQAAEQAEIASNQSAQDAEQSKEDAEQAAADSLTHAQAAQVARQGAEDAQGAAEQAQQASEDARDISIAKADESAQSAASAQQSEQNVLSMETNVTNLHGEVETNTLTVSDLADQVSNDRSQVASDAQDVRDDRDEVRGLKTETQIYRNQSEQFKNDAEAAAAAASGGLLPVGGWDASAGNLPPAPDDNTQPWYRITVAGTLPGIGQVGVGDNIYWSRSFSDWFHIDNTERFTSINGYTGGVVELDTGDIPENGPQFHTQARVRGTALTGLSETSSSKPSATDTVISALGKIVSKLWNLAVGDISGLGTMATRDTGTGGSQHRTNSQNEGKFVTVDTSQTVTGTKRLEQQTSVDFFNFRPSGDGGRYLSARLASVDALEATGRYPTFSSSVTHVLHNRVGGSSGDAELGGMVWSNLEDRPDMNWSRAAGIVFGNPDGGFRGTGSINAETIYLNGTEVFEDASGVYTAGPGALSNAVSNMLSAGTNDQIRAAIGAGTGDGNAVIGTGSSQVRTNSQLDARYAQGDNFNASGNYANLRARGTTAADVGVRTNAQNDGRFGRLTEPNTWTDTQSFSGSGITFRRSDNGTEHVYFRESDGRERALIWTEGGFGDAGLRARVRDANNSTVAEWRLTRTGQFRLVTGEFSGNGGGLSNIPSSGVNGLGSTGSSGFRTNSQNDSRFWRHSQLSFSLSGTTLTITDNS